jgi:hypothetical protein
LHLYLSQYTYIQSEKWISHSNNHKFKNKNNLYNSLYSNRYKDTLSR